MTIKEIKDAISFMKPIKIYINDELKWDDEVDYTGLPDNQIKEKYNHHVASYYKILNQELDVKFIKFEIVQFHHSIVHIETA